MRVSDDRDREWARWALERWAEFPVHDRPRPLVFVGPVVQIQLGFRSGRAKLAFLVGAIEGDSSVPTEVLDLLRTEASLGGIRQSDARVVVCNARREVGEFRTDRGPLQLEAWRLESDDVTGSIIVLDPHVARRGWKPSATPESARPYQGSPHRAHSATLASDTLSLTFNFVGGSERVVDYPSAEVFESNTAVAIVPTDAHREGFGLGAAVNAAGFARSVTVELAAPLGSRVLTDLDGSPVSVLMSDPRRSSGGCS